MNGTLFSTEMLDSPVGLFTSGLIGFMFGFFLEQAGFGSSKRLTGIFYLKDMSVLKVMLTAIVVTLIGSRILIETGLMNPAHLFALDTYWGAQIVGGALFGIGFVMGGWCPGTAFVGIVSAKMDALVFMVGAGIGSLFFNEIYSWIKPLYLGMHAGPLTLPSSLNMSANTITLLFTLGALGAFAGASQLEQKFGQKEPPDANTRRNHRIAGATMAAFALVPFFIPKPSPVKPVPAPPVESPKPSEPQSVQAEVPRPPEESKGFEVPTNPVKLSEVEGAHDHVDAPDLADWMMRQDPRLTVIDIRPREEYETFHLRGAVSIPLSELESRSSKLSKQNSIVLYSNGTTHAAQAWLEMRRWGFTKVYVLTDGILGFWRECLTPPSLQSAQPGESEEALWRRRKAWFIGPGE